MPGGDKREKLKPTHALDDLQRLVAEDGTRLITKTAQRDAAALGFHLADILDCIASLCARDFYKSMPVNDNHRLWQDVYRPTFQDTHLYVKLQLQEGKAAIISFKEDQSR